MIYALGPRALRVYEALRERIRSGELAPGAKLASHTELAAEFGVAPLTMRQVLSRLEEEGFVSREQGRGTFVQARAVPAVLIVDDELSPRAVLSDYVTRAGYRAIEATGPAEGLARLRDEPSIALVLSDVRMPDRPVGVEFIRQVRRKWPELPLAAVTAFPDDLAELQGTPECPVLIVPKPFRAAQVHEVLRLALRLAAPSRPERK
jgi:CheY-like chemotaxis protein